MKLKKVAIAMLVAALLAATVSGCGNSNTVQDETVVYDGREIKIGVIRSDSEEAHEKAIEGFRAALADKTDNNVTFYQKDISLIDEPAIASKAVKNIVNNGLSAIVASSPRAMKIASDTTSKTPIIGAGIPDICDTFKIYDWAETTGFNINAVSSLAPFDEQANMIEEVFKDKNKVALFYDGKNDYAAYQSDEIAAVLTEKGFACEVYSFDDKRLIGDTIAKAADENELIYIPYDKVVIENIAVISEACAVRQTPIVSSSEEITRQCGTITLVGDYYKIGYEAGEMAFDIIMGAKDITTTKLEYAPATEKKCNRANCDSLGLSVPADYTDF